MEYLAIKKDDELYHHGILGMKWGVRRTAPQLGHKVSEFREHRRALKSDIKSAKYGNKVTGKNGSVLNRKKARFDDPAERKKRINADIKEADDRVKFYGSKRAAKAAIDDEARYAKSVNRGKAAINTLKFGATGTLATTTALGLAGASATAGTVGLMASPLIGVGLVSAAAAAKANKYISRHAKDQVLYTDDSEYGHDLVVTFKKKR